MPLKEVIFVDNPKKLPFLVHKEKNRKLAPWNRRLVAVCMEYLGLN